MNNKLTGYPSIDKPWLKYYTEEQIKEEVPKTTCYQLLVDNSEKWSEKVAINYYGTRITYSTFIRMIDDTAKAYKCLGIKEGDIVTFLAVSTPEILCSFYALNKIGAISNMIDPRGNAKAINKYLNEVKSKLLVTLDVCYPNVVEALDNTSVRNVIVISVTNAMPSMQRLFLNTWSKIMGSYIKVKATYKDVRFTHWNRFIKDGKDEPDVKSIPYLENKEIAIVHTGGTTGIPKGVVLTNDNFNTVSHEVKYSPISVRPGEKFLNVLVPFVAYGLALGMHAPMTLGWESILIPKFSPKDMVSLMKKHNPQVVMGIATYYEPLLASDYNYRNVKAMLMGGMPTKESFEAQMNENIRKNSGKIQVCKGYSMTEASSCATCSFDSANKLGSNGIPLVKTIVAAFNPDTGEELKYNQRGEICICSPTVMARYYNNEEATHQVLRKHQDGNIWLHSGDIGYVTEDGFVYIVDRIKRMIIRQGYKVFPSEIENIFLKHPAVKSCAIIGIDDLADDKAPEAHIVLHDEFVGKDMEIEEELRHYIELYGLPTYFEPVRFKFRKELPLTNIGKIDFRALEEESKES